MKGKKEKTRSVCFGFCFSFPFIMFSLQISEEKDRLVAPMFFFLNYETIFDISSFLNFSLFDSHTENKLNKLATLRLVFQSLNQWHTLEHRHSFPVPL